MRRRRARRESCRAARQSSPRVDPPPWRRCGRQRRRSRLVGLQFPISAESLLPQFIAVGRVVDELARRGGALGEKVDAPLVELVKELVQPLPGVGGGEGIAVGFGATKRPCGRPARRRRAECRKTSGHSRSSAWDLPRATSIAKAVARIDFDQGQVQEGSYSPATHRSAAMSPLGGSGVPDLKLGTFLVRHMIEAASGCRSCSLESHLIDQR